MRKSIKCGIAAAVVVAAGIAAYQTYGAYGAQDNSLLMQNIEALASGPEPGEPSGDGSNQKSNKAIEYVYETCHEVTGFRAGIEASLNADLRATLFSLIGKKNKAKAFSAAVYKYMIYRTFDGYQKNCIDFPGSNCVCSPKNNGIWLEKPNPTPNWWGKDEKTCK